MSMLQIFNVSGSAISSQSQRLNVVASNLANADTVAGPDGSAYKARQVVFQSLLMGPMGSEAVSAGVRVSQVREDNSPGRMVFDPKHPQADQEGYVTYSNVNPVEEMVNMISASRSYQNNIEVMNTAKTLLLRGADSDLLSRDTALAMTHRGPQATLVALAGVGHAPTLVADDQRDVVIRFLLD